ncbi:hypothetical protein SAMN02745146_0616 [Hymenobacter daecheongensis DSM 21074]|uniref:Uncharacterized protein n=1 Tax=Hymenobacter daecheongensis DSM 21074 TaxID=1121955 RepID=A0A1M6AF43_9BACT|nr:hypothetical protein [Hymenobacter daecheongensis]SHI35089.1 hypothetical protein SAMN02745146_0616 [Hymenobacter daecheongensis DSM 21074]
MKAKHWICSFLLVLFCQSAFSQSGSELPDAAATSLVLSAQYSTAFGAHPSLYNGPEYVDYTKRYYKSIGHQFFLTSEKSEGSIYYNNHLFNNLKFTYDIAMDQVVLQQTTNPLTLRLVNEHVRSFTLAGRPFIRVVADSASSRALNTGYYEVLLDSTVQVLAKRYKRIQEQTSDGQLVINFLQKDAFFVKKGGVYYPANSRSAIIHLYNDHGKEIQKYIRANHLKFKTATYASDIIATTRYYLKLKHN